MTETEFLEECLDLMETYLEDGSGPDTLARVEKVIIEIKRRLTPPPLGISVSEGLGVVEKLG